MKTIFKKGEGYKRISNEKSESYIKKGWNFVPKSFWKKEERDINKDKKD